MPDSRRVLRERPVDPALKRIGEERVRNVLCAVWRVDAKVGETSGVIDLRRRYIGRRIGPIPVWGAECEGSSDPSIPFVCILLGDFKRSGLESLLQELCRQCVVPGVIAILTSYKAR